MRRVEEEPMYDQKDHTDEAGYSEEQLDIDLEIKAGEWQSLKKFSLYHHRSRQWKILATYKAITNRIVDLEKMYYALVRDNNREGGKLLEELKKLRFLQKVLRHCLTWEEKGELSCDMVPSEVWDLIK